jgi:hypothetical protein
MSSPAFVCLWRAAAVRRGLCVVGFVGGFLALAFLFGGGSAHAAESTGTQALLPGTVGKALDGLSGGADTGTKTHVPTSAEGTLTPVAKGAEQDTRAVTGLLHDLTGVSVPPPVGGGSGGTTPVGPAPHGGHHTVHHHAATGHAHPAPTAAPRAHDGAAHGGHAAASGHVPAGSRAANGGQVPLPLPVGPDGRASQSADAAGVQHRGNDAYAALETTPKPFGLVAGAVRAASAAPLRDRPFEVLELPG